MAILVDSVKSCNQDPKSYKGFFQNFQERKGNQSSSIFQGCEWKPLCFGQVQGMIDQQCLENTNNENL